MPEFIPGTELSRRFYFEAVKPLLTKHFPNLPHAAANLGTGSDVLGFDTPMSTDHDWGPSVVLFLNEADFELAPQIKTVMNYNLPFTFWGYPVNFAQAPDEPILIMQEKLEYPLNHRVFVTTVKMFFQVQLDYDIDAPLEVADWLTFPSQKLRALTADGLHYDGIGQLTEVRQKLAYYPPDVWLYLLASGWARIGQEEHLMPRAGYVGDELGSAIMASRLGRDIMSLAFLLEKQYAPYPKWFGTAFKQLKCAAVLTPLLTEVQFAKTWQAREAAIIPAYEQLAKMHNALDITGKLPEKVSNFHNRPFKVIQAEQFAAAIVAKISDPTVKKLTERSLIGSIDQFSDSTDLRSDSRWRQALKTLYL
jgi:Domain of unknown function (DUF4037)